MLISRFEALGLLPDREYVVGYRVVGSYVDEGHYDTFSFTDLENHQFEFGFYGIYGYVIFLHPSIFWVSVSTRKAEQFIERFCRGSYDQYAQRCGL